MTTTAKTKPSIKTATPAIKATPLKRLMTQTAPAKASKPPSADKQRWPDEVMSRGYSMIPSILFWGQNKLELKPEEFNVLLQLLSHWWTKGQDPHPSKETIARRMGKKPRTVQRHLTSLEEKGLIARVARFKLHKGQDSNGYDLRGLIKKLREIAPDFEKVADQNKRRRANAESKS